jgi:hypothetical protein
VGGASPPSGGPGWPTAGASWPPAARVHEFAVDTASPCAVDHIATALLDALEMACLAGGGRRLVLLPRASVTTHLLRPRGFVTIAEGCAGSWFEKLFPS